MRSIAAPVIFLGLSILPISASAQTQRGPADQATAARIERLEEQVTELRGVVAALETLVKNGGGGGGYGQRNGSAAPLPSDAGQPREQTGYNTTAPASGFEDKEQLPPLGAPQPEPDRYASRPPSQQTASAGQSMAQPRSYGGDSAAAAPAAAPKPMPAAATPQATSPKALLDQAYGALGRREYSASETYFQQFLDQYPNDLMAGSAQYGSGEAAFQSGEYRTAADRFLKTFTNFPRSDRAPEALLKLAISLHRLGENAAACDSFAELQRRYPQGPKSVQQRAEVEKKRANCS